MTRMTMSRSGFRQSSNDIQWTPRRSVQWF